MNNTDSNKPLQHFLLPDLGEGLVEGRLLECLIQPGDRFELDQSIATVETAKTAVEIPAPCAGILESWYAKTGDMVAVHTPLFSYQTTQTDAADQSTVVGQMPTHTKQTINRPPSPNQISNHQSSIIKISPALRQLAKQSGLDLTTLTPTGADGQLTAADILELLPKSLQPEISNLPPARAAMAQRLSTHAQQAIIPTTLTEQANLSAWPSASDLSVRLIQACCQAFSIAPALNARIENLQYQQTEQIDLGIAVDRDATLYCPVISNAQTKTRATLRTILDRIKTHPHNAQETSPSFVLSNIGMIAGLFATPLVISPSVATLAVGRRHQQPVVLNNGDIAPQTILPLSLSFDHRCVTGADAARFLAAFLNAIEAPNGT